MKNRTILAGLVLALLAAGCGPKTAATANLGADELFQRGEQALQAHKWTDAAELFERFSLTFPSHPRAQEARFKVGEAYFGKKEYITAANEYARLANDYPAGPYADDSRYKVCESYYMLSPKPDLDQQYTLSAIDHCESLIAYYATSEFAEKGKALLVEMKTKLALKEFNTGEFYFDRKAYDPALIYYEKAAVNYPETEVAPRALMRMYETYRILKYDEEMEQAKQRILKDYPNSPEAKLLQQPAPAAS